MRTIHTLVAVVALATGAGCKNDTQKQADKVGDKQKEVVEARRDVAKQQRELDKARTDLADAKMQYANAVKDRLAKIDQKLDDLAARSDAASRDAAVRLRA